jgi:hypothetical protein
LEIHNKKDGEKTFGATTRFDWYILQNSKSNEGSSLTQEAIVVDEQGNQHEFDLSKLPFLPNYNFKELWGILAKKKEDRLDILYSRSLHGNDKQNMSKRKHDNFKHPCLHAMHKDGEVVFLYSTDKSCLFVPKVILNDGETIYPIIDIKGEYGTTDHTFGIKLPCLPNYNFEGFRNILAKREEDHLEIIHSNIHDPRRPDMSKTSNNEFKYPCVHAMYQDKPISLYYSTQKSDMFVPKVIINGGRHTYSLVDTGGEYGMCQDVFGIKADSLEYAEKVKRAIESARFQEIIKATKWSSFRTDHRMFKYFRKDFWKFFIDKDGNEIPARLSIQKPRGWT